MVTGFGQSGHRMCGRPLLVLLGAITAIALVVHLLTSPSPLPSTYPKAIAGFFNHDDIDQPVPSQRRSTIGKMAMLYGDPDPVYERALALHQPHNARFGYSMKILRSQILSGYWSKPAYITKLLIDQLQKPVENRLEWLFWVDSDVVLMNPKIPLEIFLPPPEYSHINLIVTNEPIGLNNGVFFIRVHEWSVKLMQAVSAIKTYKPDVFLPASDQSAMMLLLDTDEFRDQTIHVPLRWFNARPGNRGGVDPFPWNPTAKWRDTSIKEGDFCVHFPGHHAARNRRMTGWIDFANTHNSSWEVDLELTSYPQEIERFWREEAPKEKETMVAVMQHAYDVMEEQERTAKGIDQPAPAANASDP